MFSIRDVCNGRPGAGGDRCAGFSHMNLSRRSRWIAAAAALLLVALAAVWGWRTMQPHAAATTRYVEVVRGAYLLPRPDALPAFDLLRHDDMPFRNDALKGKWSFLIFGYTSCPDFCPTALVEFNEVHRLLGLQGGAARDVQFVMVSVDPERDTTKLLGAYVPQFNREFIGVTGGAAAIARLAESMGAVYEKHSVQADGSYLVDHTATVHLINPQGQLQGVFSPPPVAADLVLGFQKIREQLKAPAR